MIPCVVYVVSLTVYTSSYFTAVGDYVKEDENVGEIETDKVSVESGHRIYRKRVSESRHPSHSDIDIVVDCFSVIMDCLLFNFYLMY